MKKQEAFGQISAMSGIVKLIDIVNIIKKIDNFQEETISKLNPVDDYKEGTPVDEIYIDLSYQRKLRIQEILNRLLDQDGYDKTAAGHIDLAKRNDGRLFCWDGFHRAIMACIAGCTRIPDSTFTHDKGLKPSKEKEIEANKFELRNGQATKINAGQLFKSQVTGNRPKALETLEVMKTCKLNIEGVNPDVDAYELGGFAFFLKHYADYEERFLKTASTIIRKTWDDKKTMSVTLLIGLAHYLAASQKPDVRVIDSIDVQDKIKEIVGTGKDKKNQQYFLQPMLKGKTAESVSYNLVDKGLADLYNDKGKEVKSFFKQLGLEDDELDSLDRD
tara:strand:+ start:3155 stop:4150 length:996 start_codon:yes stop_codon:yes gene_type:complete